jgi:hypothetical protein
MQQIEQHNPPNDPELLAYYAAHERAQVKNHKLCCVMVWLTATETR